MLSPEDLTQTASTGPIERMPTQITTTGPVEQMPPTLTPYRVSNGRRQHFLQQKQQDRNTGDMSSLELETAHAKLAWRQVIQLREENKRLRCELNASQVGVGKSGHNSQEAENDYQNQLRDALDQCNQLENRYQELHQSFQVAAEEEAHKMVVEAARALEQSPNSAPILLQDVVKTLELHARQLEDKQLVEASYLKREVQRMMEHLQQERQEVEVERQKVFAMQNTAHEQAQLRHKALRTRLRAQRMASLAYTTTGALVLLVVLQFVFLWFFHVPSSTLLSFSLIAPIVVCSLLGGLLAQPLSMLRHIYKSAPHRQTVKNKA